MYIIAVSEEEFSGGKELAASLAKRFSCRLVSNEILVEWAAAWGADRQELKATLEASLGWVDRLTHTTRIQVCVLQAALAEEIRGGCVVCFAAASDLLPLDAPNIVRIRVEASYQSRLSAVRDRLKLNLGEAHKCLRERDRRNRRWRSYLHGESGGNGYAAPVDLVVNLENTSIDELCEIVEDRIRQRNDAREESLEWLENFALSTLVKSKLALNPDTAHLEIEARANDGAVVLQGKVRCFADIYALKRVVLQMREVTSLDVSAVQLPEELVIASAADHQARVSRPIRLAWLLSGAAAIALSLALIQVALGGGWGWGRKATAPLRNFAGIITDSLCAGRHQGFKQDADCVRACVKQPGAKYALYDGSRTYVISDQREGERFAAQRVVVRGSVDQEAGILRVDSMEAATP